VTAAAIRDLGAPGMLAGLSLIAFTRVIGPRAITFQWRRSRSSSIHAPTSPHKSQITASSQIAYFIGPPPLRESDHSMKGAAFSPASSTAP
jgi:hypothetical protein